MNKFAVAITFALLLCCASVHSATVHPYHVSLAEVEFNPKTGNFEVALRVWPEDLEKALSANEKRTVDLDKEKKLDELIARYFEEKFSIAAAGKKKAKEKEAAKKSLKMIGHELDRKSAWIYFVIPGDKSAETYKIENRIFMELNEEQFNQVNLKYGKELQRFSITIGKSSAEFKLVPKVSKPNKRF